MQLAREVPVRLVWRDKGGDGDAAREGKEEGDFADTANLAGERGAERREEGGGKGDPGVAEEEEGSSKERRRRTFSTRLAGSNPKSLFSPNRILSPSSRYACSPLCSRCCSRAVAMVLCRSSVRPRWGGCRGKGRRRCGGVAEDARR